MYCNAFQHYLDFWVLSLSSSQCIMGLLLHERCDSLNLAQSRYLLNSLHTIIYKGSSLEQSRIVTANNRTTTAKDKTRQDKKRSIPARISSSSPACE